MESPQVAPADEVENTWGTDEHLAFSASIYMLRNTHQHHVQLSAMADLKANILITVSSILLSVTIGLSANEGMRPSLAVLTIGTLSGAFFAIISVLPKFRFRAAQPPATVNLLFFGSFAHMREDEFVERIASITADRDEVIRAQVRDIHQLGCYLHSQKYRWLRVAYVCFLFGLLAGGATELVDRVF